MLTLRLETLRLNDATRVLDLGCGRGRHLHAAYAKGNIHAVGLDLSEEDIMATKEGFAPFLKSPPPGATHSLISGDALRLPFADASFDVIICSEVLEHIEDYQSVLKEIARVAAPGARIGISVPRGWPERICWTLAPKYPAPASVGGHVRIFKADVLKNAVVAEGFDYRGKHYAHGLHSPYWWLRCAFWESQDDNWAVRQYQKFLEWDIMKRPLLTRVLEAIADPLMGKSVAMYFEKPAP
ncbi:MAG: class I SAM-dependent methyltransferase [Pseudomonadota bacterium]